MTTHIFNVGDRVFIRNWEDMEKEFGLSNFGGAIKTDRYTFIDAMQHLCGEPAIIISLEEPPTTPNVPAVYLKFENPDLNDRYSFTTQMIRPALPLPLDFFGVPELPNVPPQYPKNICIPAPDRTITKVIFIDQNNGTHLPFCSHCHQHLFDTAQKYCGYCGYEFEDW